MGITARAYVQLLQCKPLSYYFSFIVSLPFLHISNKRVLLSPWISVISVINTIKQAILGPLHHS
jgi:hypothetical protein